jgi:hypothetical protein
MSKVLQVQGEKIFAKYLYLLKTVILCLPYITGYFVHVEMSLSSDLLNVLHKLEDVCLLKVFANLCVLIGPVAKEV